MVLGHNPCLFNPGVFQPSPSDKKSELLPAGWNSNKDLYILRYEAKDGSKKLLVKAVTVENSMIINVLVSL